MQVVVSRVLGFVCAACVGVAPCAGQNGTVRIAMKPEARTASASGEAGVLHVRDIVEIAGATEVEMKRWGDVVIAKATGAGRSYTIEMNELRAALDGVGINWGRVSLSGKSCVVDAGSDAHLSVPGKVKDSTAVKTHQQIDFSGQPTVRTRIGERIGDLLGVENCDLRVLFDRADEEFVNQATGTRRVDIQPAAASASGRVPVRVYVYEHDRVIAERTVGVGVLVNRQMATATRLIERGSAITRDEFEVNKKWVSPADKVSVDPAKLDGAVASVRIAPGQAISASDVAAAIACKRGEIVQVHALAGGVTVRVKARAMAPARDGEIVQLKLDGSDKPFAARMSGQGRAVMLVASENDVQEARR